MNPRKRKKNPPDPSPSLFGSLFAGCTPPSPFGSFPNYLSSPASLDLELPARNWPVLFPSLSGRRSVWRVKMLIQLKFGVIALGFEEFILLLALPARSVCYEVVSPGLHSPSGFGCLWGKREGVYVSIVQFVPALVRSRVSTFLGVPILEVAHRIAPCAGHLRRLASSSAFVASGYHNWPTKSIWIASCRLLGLNQSQIMALACFATDGIPVDLRPRYASPIYRILVSRSELQVCFIFIFPLVFRGIHFHVVDLQVSILLHTLFEFGFRFRNVAVLPSRILSLVWLSCARFYECIICSILFLVYC